MKIVIEVEDESGVTLGDWLSASGAVIEASTNFVDWDSLHNGGDVPVSWSGRILLQVAHQLATVGRGRWRK